MAGFLAHLATRLGGSEELLRPRMPSLFEPAPTVALDPTSASLPSDQHPLARGFEHLDETDLQVFDSDQQLLFNLDSSGPELFFRASF